MDILAFLVCLAATAAAGATGILFPPGNWYRGLIRPAWTPPDRAFPIIWTTLYLMMAIAAARIAAFAGVAPGTGLALSLWALQIALNTLWTPVFFGLRRMRAGLFIIGALWLAVAATCSAFAAIDGVAALLMLPYLLWVSVAAALNATLLRLNPGASAVGR